MHECFYYIRSMTHCHSNLRQVYDSCNKYVMTFTQQSVVAVTGSHSSPHTCYYLSDTIKALGWLPSCEVNNSFFFLSAHPRLLFSHFFSPVSPLLTHSHFHLSLVHYLHFTALYLSSSPALLPRRQTTCLLQNVRSALIPVDPSASHMTD